MVKFPREPWLGMRLLHWAFQIHSPSRAWLSMPSAYSFVGALRGGRDVYIPQERWVQLREALLSTKGGERIRVKVI